MRIVFLDYLRVIAIFMVMLVHACECYYLGDGGLKIATAADISGSCRCWSGFIC